MGRDCIHYLLANSHSFLTQLTFFKSGFQICGTNFATASLKRKHDLIRRSKLIISGVHLSHLSQLEKKERKYPKKNSLISGLQLLFKRDPMLSQARCCRLIHSFESYLKKLESGCLERLANKRKCCSLGKLFIQIFGFAFTS